MTPRKPRATAPPKLTAGQQMIKELSQDGDPFSLTFLIEEAGQHADFLERLRPVLNGDRDAWLDVKIGEKTVEVVVANPLTQYRQLSEHLRKLLLTIKTQRAKAPHAPGHKDPAAV